MPRAFAITVSTNSITLNGQDRGEVSFTVSNTSGSKLRGRAVLKALGSTQSDWLRVVDESERDFDSQTVHQFTIKVAVPQGTPEGTYSFRLDVVSVENPDDVFDEGPVVAFEVHEAEVPVPKPFPWWIVVAAAGFLIVAGAVTWILIPKKATVPNVIGKIQEDAQEEVEKSGLKVNSVSKRSYREGDEKLGKVVAQDPEPEEKVEKGTTVTLEIAAKEMFDDNLADLYVKEFNLEPEPPILRRPVTVHITIWNQGRKNAGSFRVQWFAEERFPTPVKEWTVEELAARGGRILTHTIRGYSSRRIRTKVVIDPRKEVRETDENNNVFVKTIPVR